jgi:hypothetical protein
MFRSNEINIVMAGLVPAMTMHEAPWRSVHRDARDKPTHDVNENERNLL